MIVPDSVSVKIVGHPSVSFFHSSSNRTVRNTNAFWTAQISGSAGARYGGALVDVLWHPRRKRGGSRNAAESVPARSDGPSFVRSHLVPRVSRLLSAGWLGGMMRHGSFAVPGRARTTSGLHNLYHLGALLCWLLPILDWGVPNHGDYREDCPGLVLICRSPGV